MSGFPESLRPIPKITLTPAFFLLLVLYAFAGNLTLLPCILLAVLLHECGHFIAIRLCGLKIDGVKATIVGFVIYTNVGLSSYAYEIIVALAGPAASVLIALCCSYAASCGFFPEKLYLFAGANILFGLFNLLPAAKLDGGRALHRFFCLLFPPDTAYRAACVINLLTAFAVILGGGIVLYQTKYNLSLLLIGVWLLFGFGPEY